MRDDGKRIHTLVVRIDSDLWERIEALADDEQTRSDVIRALLYDGLVIHGKTVQPRACVRLVDRGTPVRSKSTG
jgi:hypothetical protein